MLRHGKLRAALNFGNPVLARQQEGGPVGITVDLAAAIAQAVGADLEFVAFDRAFDVASSAPHDQWDICFLAVDPSRAEVIAFTEPYVRISGCYLLGPDFQEADCDDVARLGLRIGVVVGSAYALFLSRQPNAENLVIYSTTQQACAAFDEGRVHGLAGIEQVMIEQALRQPDRRVLRPPFMEIRQAMGLPGDRAALLPDLQMLLSDLRDSGKLSEILARHGVPGDCAI